MMEEIESVHMQNSQTAVFGGVDTSGHGSHDTIDSGYLSSLTPHTDSYVSTTGYRTRSSSGLPLSAKKQHRFRPDALRCEKPQSRRRSNFTTCLSNSLVTDYAINQNSTVDDRHESSTSSLSFSLPSSCTRVSRSLVHSTPSCHATNYGEVSLDGDRNRRNWRTTVLITPASVTDFRLMSPSPAVPSSSYVATEPIQEEDVEMKLVGASSNVDEKARRQITTTTRTTTRTPPRLRIPPIPRIVLSPIRRRNSPVAITSAENRKLRELCISDLAASEIKPKKLDFSRRGLSAVLRSSSNNGNNRGDGDGNSGSNHGSNSDNNNGAISIYAGKERVDFLSLLGEQSNHLNVVSKILSCLGDEDLCTVTRVSNPWKRLCEGDYAANARRRHFLLRKQNIKENLRVTTKRSKGEEDMQTSPRSRHYVRKGCLIDVKNLLNIQMQRKPPSSPPVSPSKVKFHSFVKASRTLASGEYLLPCPKCRFPCYVDSEKNMGSCSRQGCSIEFCISCSSKAHMGPCKTPLLATPTKRNSKRLIVGSRQSKRNLRRL